MIILCVIDVSGVSYFTVGTSDFNIEWWFLGVWILSLIGIELRHHGCNELVLWHREVLGKILGYMYGTPIETYDEIKIIPTKWPTDKTFDDNNESFLDLGLD